MSTIILEGVTKAFKGKTAVDKVDLEAADGQFLIIVGPSGCGKTTTLRMLAGFEKPTQGVVRIGGRVMNDVPPKDRDVAMVFQNYALLPHLTVFKNLSFGMRIRHEPRKVIEREVAAIAEMLGIASLLDRKPAELSGGERQRVALGRALLRKPQAFLLDEPLSNLDAALRAQMRFELKRIHAQFPVTTVYVTHDQVEAMTMADQIALMNNGRLQQIAPPEMLYSEPANSFVAGFIGSPKINLVPGQVLRDTETPAVSVLSCRIPVNGDLGSVLRRMDGDSVVIGLRPEEIRPCTAGAGGDQPVFHGLIELIEPLGSETHVAIRAGDQTLTCRFPPRSGLEVGATINVQFDPQQMKVFDAQSGMRLG
jgi:multiple sugar transport system ATP-binding protein